MMLKPALRPPLRVPVRGTNAPREGVGGYRALAQKLLARRAATPYGGNMPSPATVTVGASDANSTVATGRSVYTPATLPDSADITRVSGNNPVSASGNWTQRYINTDAGSSLGPSRGNGWRFTLPATATMFDVCCRNLSSDSTFRVRINGLWVQTADFTTAPTTDGGHFYYTKFSGLSPGDLVELYVGAGAQIRGFNVGTGAAAALTPLPAPEADPINVLVYGDSYPYGSGPASCRGAWPHKLAERWGIPNLVNSGAPATGLIANKGGASKTFINRIADVTRVYTPDIILVPGSLNDNGQGASNVQTAATTFLTALGAAAPNALIAWFGIEHSPSNNPSSAYDAAVAAGFAAAGLGGRAKFFPTLDGTYQDSADSSLYAADTTHMSDAGTARYVTAADADFAAWLATL